MGKCPTCGRGQIRSREQNNRMWPMLREISAKVVWYGKKLEDFEWKDVLTAGLKKQTAVPGIDGGFVILGAHTSKLSPAEMSALLELIAVFGAEHGVVFSDNPP